MKDIRVEEVVSKKQSNLQRNFYFLFTVYVSSIYVFSFRAEYNTISNALFLVVLGYSVLKIIQSLTIHLDKYFIALISFVLYSYISILWTPVQANGIIISNTLSTLMLLSFLTFQGFINVQKGLEKLLISLYISGMIMCVYTIFLYNPINFLNSIFSGQRLGSEVNQANILGMYAAYTTVLNVYLGITKKNIIIAVLSIVPFLVTVSSGSRTGILICLLGIALFLILKDGMKKFFKGTIFGVFSLLIMYVIINMSIFSNITSRFQNLFNIFGDSSYVDSSTNIRIFMIQYGLDLFFEKPFIGYGANSSQHLLSLVSSYNSYLHNNYVELLVNYGAIGFLLFYSVYIYVFVKAIPLLQMKNPHLAVTITILLMTLMADFGTVSYYRKLTFILLTLGVIAVNYKTNESIRRDCNKKLQGG